MRAKLSSLLALAFVLGAASIALSSGGASAAASHGPSVSAALQSLKQSGAIAPADYSRYASDYATATKSLKKLSGTRRTELGAVITNVQAIAAAGGFIPSRLPALFLTLERNQQWWTTKPLLSGSTRVSFPGSRLVWEYYPGQGIEIQWLGTFGEANGYFLSGNQNANLRALLNEIIPLATVRAGGIAWEYLFRFDGGLPPWTSGLSQGTAIQSLARGFSRLGDPAYKAAAQSALGIFQKPPPTGVRIATAAGAHYIQYTFAPQDRILNGFIQSLVGLYDYTSITKDPLGLRLFQAGDAEARVEVPHYDTGAWSLYDQYGESDLSYHNLLTGFLKNLCQRTRQGLPLTTPAPTPTPTAPANPGQPAPGSSTTPSGSGTTGVSGGTAPPASAASAAHSATAIAATTAAAATTQPTVANDPDSIFCTTANHFTADLHTPPTLTLLTTKLSGGTRAGVRFALSKISNVSLTVRKGTRVVWTNRATVAHGKPQVLWVTPAQGGTFNVTVSATDLAGNSSSTSGTITVTRKSKSH